MAGFWFLVSVVLIIMLFARRKKDDSYAQGYWNGYRAFGDMVRDLIKAKRIDEDSLQGLIDIGERGGSVADTTTTIAATASQQNRVSDAEAQFLADTYDGDDDQLEITEPTEEAQVAQDYTVATPVETPQPVVMTADQKAARSLRNLNIILYTASFLLVAAGALFVASSSTPLTKLLSVIVIIAAFYVSGFMIYSKSERLRPAALAFLGTGLALIPFAGLALQQYTNLSTAQSWLITSFVGLVTYFLVAIRLQSQLVSYLTMAFVLSLAGTMTAASASAIVWQFVAIIGVSLIASVVAYLKPKWLPAVFSQPVERSGQIVTPVVLVASLFVFDKLLLSGYEIVFAVATLHYIVAWMQTRNIVYETTVRVLLYVVLALVAWDVWNGNLAVTAFTMVLLMSFQHAYSLYMVNRPGRFVSEQAWIMTLFGLQLFLVLFWTNYHLAATFSTVALAVTGLTSLIVAVRLRKVGYGYIGFGISLILPFVVARGLLTPDLPWWMLASWFIAATVAALLLYARWRHRSVSLRYFMTAAYITYLFFAIVVAALEGSSAFMTVTYICAAIILLAASYFARNPASQIVVPIFVLLSVASLGDLLHISQPWYVMFVSSVSAVILWVMTIVHGHLRQLYRQTAMLASGQLLFLFIFSAVIFSDTNANVSVAILLLIAGFGSLILRWWCQAKAPHLNKVFTISYVVYFAAAFMVASLISTAWWTAVAAAGIVLFLFASYIERWPLIQIVASVLTVITLSLMSSLIHLPGHWSPLFVFGGAAVLFYIVAHMHRAYGQVKRRLIMMVTAQVTLFLVIFGGMSGYRTAVIVSFIILLSWALVSLAARWWYRGRSREYSSLFLVSYPIYYFGALLLLDPLASTWSWTVAAGAGVALFSAASYVERRLWLQAIASVLAIATLAFTASLVDLPSHWSPLFVFGGAAALFYVATILHRMYGQTKRQFMMATTAQITLFWIVFAGVSGHHAATLVSFIVMLAWAIISLAIRWWYRDKSSSYSQLFLASYPIYYFGALMLLNPLASTWSWTAAAGVGVVLFFLASYAERQAWLQIIASIFSVVTLSFVTSLIHLPSQWFALFVFGGAAVLFYAATIFHFMYRQAERQLLMTTTAQVTMFCIVFAGLTGHYIAILTSFIVLLVWSIASLVVRWQCRDRSQSYSALFRVLYPTYYVTALLLLAPLAPMWSVIAFAVGTIIFWVASYAERSPAISVLGDVLLAVTLFIFWDWMNFSAEWMLIGIASILSAIFYAGHWILKAIGDMWRSRTLLYATWLVLLSVILLQFFDESKIVAVSAMIIAFAATLIIEGLQTKRYAIVESAVYIGTFGMQRIAEQLWPELSIILYAHWWAVVIALVAIMRQTYRRARLVIAMCLVTISSGVYALTHGGNYQLLFLIEHLGLLVAGALLSKSWAIWWGISASAIAILYFLRGYTFLLLGFLGLLMIAIVVWRLMSGSKSTT